MYDQISKHLGQVYVLDKKMNFLNGKRRIALVSATHYVLNDPDKLSIKYIAAWANFGLDLQGEII
jgi:hypothetical protein